MLQATLFFVTKMHERVNLPLLPEEIPPHLTADGFISASQVVEALALPILDQSDEAQNAWGDFAVAVAEYQAEGSLQDHPVLRGIGESKGKSRRAMKNDRKDLAVPRKKTPGKLAAGAIEKAIRDNLNSFALKQF